MPPQLECIGLKVGLCSELKEFEQSRKGLLEPTVGTKLILRVDKALFELMFQVITSIDRRSVKCPRPRKCFLDFRLKQNN
jgi:hypothetical protein